MLRSLVFFDPWKPPLGNKETVVGSIVISSGNLTHKAISSLTPEFMIEIGHISNAVTRFDPDCLSGSYTRFNTINRNLNLLIRRLLGLSVCHPEFHAQSASASIYDVFSLEPMEMFGCNLILLYHHDFLAIWFRITPVTMFTVTDSYQRQTYVVEISPAEIRKIPAKRTIADLIAFLTF